MPERRVSVKKSSTLVGTVVLVLIALTASGSFAGVAGAAGPDRSTLPGSAPVWANAQHFANGANANDSIGFRVYLAWNDAAAAEAFASAVSDPHSSSYGHYLTAAQFRQKFAPSAAQVSAVQSWLRSQGFSVNYTPSNNHYVSAQGTVAQAQAAFATQFGMYNVNG